MILVNFYEEREVSPSGYGMFAAYVRSWRRPISRSRQVKDQQALLAVVWLLHQNQVALADSMQLMSRWFLRSGVSELTLELQPKMEEMLANCISINHALVGLEERLAGLGEGQR
jgi:hypothetical protein